MFFNLIFFNQNLMYFKQFFQVIEKIMADYGRFSKDYAENLLFFVKMIKTLII